MTKLIIGLGNIGDEYKNTRHNIGFLVIEELANTLGETWKKKSRLKAEIAKGRMGDIRVVLAKPTTYMNLSGEAAAALVRRFAPNEIVVIYDDADLPFGKLRTKIGGGSAGHNGVKSLDKLIGNDQYRRIRIGIGRPKNDKQPLDTWVLGNWGKEEQQELPGIIENVLKEI